MGAIILLFSIIVYGVFFASFVYLVFFIGGDMAPFVEVPKTIDAGPAGMPGAPAALMNIGLLLLFGLQHSIMARPGFKRGLTKIIPHQTERSVYVLMSVICILLLFYFWQPMPSIVWSVSSPLWSGVLTALFFFGFALLLLSTFAINHFELFGLMQGWFGFKTKEMPAPTFKVATLYKSVRHPLYLGFLIAFWATPTMTAGHLLFAAIWTAYIFVAIGYEERDLIDLFGENYRAYMAKTPMILPFIGSRK